MRDRASSDITIGIAALGRLKSPARDTVTTFRRLLTYAKYISIASGFVCRTADSGDPRVASRASVENDEQSNRETWQLRRLLGTIPADDDDRPRRSRGAWLWRRPEPRALAAKPPLVRHRALGDG